MCLVTTCVNLPLRKAANASAIFLHISRVDGLGGLMEFRVHVWYHMIPLSALQRVSFGFFALLHCFFFFGFAYFALQILKIFIASSPAGRATFRRGRRD